MNARKYLAEVLGTFVLVFCGSMSILAAIAMDAPILVVVPFGFGLALLGAIYAFGPTSGAHFNPAVTLGALLDGRIGPVDAGAYVIAQVVGAIGASALVGVVAGGQVMVARTTNGVGQGIAPLAGFTIEVVTTAIFLTVILTSSKRLPAQAPFVIALTLAMIHFASIPFSGASVNPARSLGPALVGGDLSQVWIYLTAPFIGAVIGWALFRVFERGDDVESEEA